MIYDPIGRSFKKLRVSLTHDCNYACLYCASGDHDLIANDPGVNSNHHRPHLKTDELLTIIKKLNNELQLEAVRLTGGEPLLHPRLRSIVLGIKELGIENIGMTTNGHLLAGKATELYAAGLKSVNISLDAISEQTFTRMSRFYGLSKVLKSIDKVIETGLTVKLNCVVVADENEKEIVPLLEYAMQKGIVIRFLELMNMGPLHSKGSTKIVTAQNILETIAEKYSFIHLPDEHGSTAKYWSINGIKVFGIIANDSSPFCNECNRLRLDSYGNIYGCLSSLIPVEVGPEITRFKLKSALQMAITHKQQTHFVGNKRTMQSIGG